MGISRGVLKKYDTSQMIEKYDIAQMRLGPELPPGNHFEGKGLLCECASKNSHVVESLLEYTQAARRMLGKELL